MKCPVDKDAVRRLFIKNAKDIWRDSKLIDNIDLRVQLIDHDTMMEVWKAPLALYREERGRQKAINDTLVKTFKVQTLKVSKDACKWSKKKLTDGLRHEALHLGYEGHGKDFIKVAKMKGIPITRNILEGGTIKLERKEGSRYKTIGEFNTDDEAMEYFNKNYKGKGPKGQKWRLVY